MEEDDQELSLSVKDYLAYASKLNIDEQQLKSLKCHFDTHSSRHQFQDLVFRQALSASELEELLGCEPRMHKLASVLFSAVDQQGDHLIKFEDLLVAFQALEALAAASDIEIGVLLHHLFLLVDRDCDDMIARDEGSRLATLVVEIADACQQSTLLAIPTVSNTEEGCQTSKDEVIKQLVQAMCDDKGVMREQEKAFKEAYQQVSDLNHDHRARIAGVELHLQLLEDRKEQTVAESLLRQHLALFKDEYEAAMAVPLLRLEDACKAIAASHPEATSHSCRIKTHQ